MTLLRRLWAWLVAPLPPVRADVTKHREFVEVERKLAALETELKLVQRRR